MSRGGQIYDFNNVTKFLKTHTRIFYIQKKAHTKCLNIKIRIFAAEVGYHEIRNYC